MAICPKKKENQCGNMQQSFQIISLPQHTLAIGSSYFVGHNIYVLDGIEKRQESMTTQFPYSDISCRRVLVSEGKINWDQIPSNVEGNVSLVLMLQVDRLATHLAQLISNAEGSAMLLDGSTRIVASSSVSLRCHDHTKLQQSWQMAMAWSVDHRLRRGLSLSTDLSWLVHGQCFLSASTQDTQAPICLSLCYIIHHTATGLYLRDVTMLRWVVLATNRVTGRWFISFHKLHAVARQHVVSILQSIIILLYFVINCVSILQSIIILHELNNYRWLGDKPTQSATKVQAMFQQNTVYRHC